MNPDRPTQKKSPFRRLLLPLLFVVIIICGLLAVTHFAPQSVSQQFGSYSIFESSYKSQIKSLNKNQYNIVVGKAEDGVSQFVAHYANSTQNKYQIKQRYLQSNSHSIGHQLKHYANTVNSFLISILSSGVSNATQNSTRLWIIWGLNAQFTSEQAASVTLLAIQYPLDKVLVVVNSAQKIPGVNIVKFKRPSVKALTKLYSGLGINEITQSSIETYYQNNLSRILNTVYQQSPQQTFWATFNQQLQKIQLFLSNSSKQLNKFNRVCQKGSYQSKTVNTLSLHNGILAYVNNTYYWTQPNYVYAFRRYSNKPCILDVQFVAAPQIPKQRKEITPPVKQDSTISNNTTANSTKQTQKPSQKKSKKKL